MHVMDAWAVLVRPCAAFATAAARVPLNTRASTSTSTRIPRASRRTKSSARTRPIGAPRSDLCLEAGDADGADTRMRVVGDQARDLARSFLGHGAAMRTEGQKHAGRTVVGGAVRLAARCAFAHDVGCLEQLPQIGRSADCQSSSVRLVPMASALVFAGPGPIALRATLQPWETPRLGSYVVRGAQYEVRGERLRAGPSAALRGRSRPAAKLGRIAAHARKCPSDSANPTESFDELRHPLQSLPGPRAPPAPHVRNAQHRVPLPRSDLRGGPRPQDGLFSALALGRPADAVGRCEIPVQRLRDSLMRAAAGRRGPCISATTGASS